MHRVHLSKTDVCAEPKVYSLTSIFRCVSSYLTQNWVNSMAISLWTSWFTV